MTSQNANAQPIESIRPAPDAKTPPDKFALFLNATRAPYLTAILVPVLLGAAVAFHDGSVNILLTLLTLVAVALFHLGSNVINDYFDHLSGADEANQNPGPFFGGSRVIQRGLLAPRQVL